MALLSKVSLVVFGFLAGGSVAAPVLLIADPPLVWDDSNAYCQEKLGTDLASIHSQAENEAIVAELQARGVDRVHFGLNDKMIEDSWEFVDGTSVTYTNWRYDQPNNVDDQDCGFIDAGDNGYWKDDACACRSDQCYKYDGILCNDPKNFVLHVSEIERVPNEANAFCAERYGTELASISSQAENDLILNLMNVLGQERAHFGFNDIAKEGDWVWFDGTPVTYTNWKSNQPNNWYYQHCSMFDAGQGGVWQDIECGCNAKECTKYKAFLCTAPESFPTSTIAGDSWILGQ